MSIVIITGLVVYLLIAIGVFKPFAPKFLSNKTSSVAIGEIQIQQLTATIDKVIGSKLYITDVDTGKKYTVTVSPKTTISISYNFNNIPKIKERTPTFIAGQRVYINTPTVVKTLKSKFTAVSIAILVNLTLERGVVDTYTSNNISITLFKEDNNKFWKISNETKSYLLDKSTEYFVNHTNDINIYDPINPSDVNSSTDTSFVHIYSHQTDSKTNLPIADLVVVNKPR